MANRSELGYEVRVGGYTDQRRRSGRLLRGRRGRSAPPHSHYLCSGIISNSLLSLNFSSFSFSPRRFLGYDARFRSQF